MVSALAVSQAKYWHLRQTELFNGLPSADLKELGVLFDTNLIEQGEAIYRIGDVARRVHLLKTGKIKLSCASGDGKELILGYLGPGEIFGEMAVTADALRGESATVIEDAFICSIDKDDFEGVLFKHPQVALAISRIIGQRKQRVERRVVDLVTKDVRTRLAHTLAELAEEFGDQDEIGIRVDLPLTQSDLAQLVGSTRETTSTVFNEFRRADLVDSEGRTIWVIEPATLASYSFNGDLGAGRAA